jgi:hypothetical protein
MNERKPPNPVSAKPSPAHPRELEPATWDTTPVRKRQPQPGRQSVLIINAPYPSAHGPAGAAGIRARAMARGLSARGHVVTVVCAGDRSARAQTEAGVEVVPAPYVDVKDNARRVGVELRELRTADHRDRPGRRALAREVGSTLRARLLHRLGARRDPGRPTRRRDSRRNRQRRAGVRASRGARRAAVARRLQRSLVPHNLDRTNGSSATQWMRPWRRACSGGRRA